MYSFGAICYMLYHGYFRGICDAVPFVYSPCLTLYETVCREG